MQRTWTDRRKRIVVESLFFLLLCVIILIDQITKYHFSSMLAEGESQVVIDGFFYFSHYRNEGGAWSIMSNVSWAQTFFKILTVFAVIGFVVFYIYALKKNYRWLKVSLVFVIAGTIGNFIDRILFNEVIDFLGFIFWGYYFPVFNIADSFLVVGTIMIVLHFLFFDKDAIFRKKDANKEVSDK